MKTATVSNVTGAYNRYARQAGKTLAERVEQQGPNVLALHPVDGGYKVEVIHLSDPNSFGAVAFQEIAEYEDGEIDPELGLFSQLRVFNETAVVGATLSPSPVIDA